MEAFAAQAMAAIDDLGLEPATVNRGGGALSRGHPIGASGAILAVRLFSELRSEASGALGLAAIAAAGGLGSAALFERV
jgi:acetyl-CoA C-acetyltransferase